MPDPGDSNPGLIESTRRFSSLFSEWICNLTFKQFADRSQVKSPTSSLYPAKEEAFYHSMETIDISSSSGSDFDLDSDDDLEEVSKPETSNIWESQPEQAFNADVFSKRKLPHSFDRKISEPEGTSSTNLSSTRKLPPNWRFIPKDHARDEGSQVQGSKLPSSSRRGPHLNTGQHSRAESSASTSYAYEQALNRRTLPSSLQPSGSLIKQNHHGDSVGSSRNNGGVYHPVALSGVRSTSYANDGFNRGYDIDPNMFDSNRPRILPHSLMRGKAVPSTQFGSSGDPLQNMGFVEERVTGDERVIYQAALRDLSQPKKELDVPDGTLSVPLLRHQKIALAWMVEKESNVHCVGGILADDQGLGKTISTIALILKQKSIHSEKHDNHIAEALDLDGDGDDDDAGKGKKISDDKPETLNLDDDDEDDNGSAAPATEKIKEEVDVPKRISNASSSHQSVYPTSSRKKPAAGTLIVCPATVLRQWARELDDKVAVGGKLSVLIYHGGNRTKDPIELSKYDVVLTTYAIVSNEVPKQPLVDEDDAELKFGERFGITSEFSANKKRKQSSTTSKKGKKGRKLDDSSFCSDAGTLAKVSWSRVVLDEAQTIKNHRTQTARACCGLRAKRRWCLSGTPIQNSIDEVYSYFRFLRHELYSDYKKFCDAIKFPISRDPVLGYKKLQAVLKTLLLRRTKSTLLDGEPIINLPPKHIKMKTVSFTLEERAFYNQLEAQSRSQFKEYADAGTVNQNYANILLMILRLRQACDHPLLVKGFKAQPARRTSLDEAKKLSRLMLIKLLNLLEAPSSICLICSDPAEDGVITICGHVFCYQCVGDYLTGDDTMCPARKCKGQLSEDVLFSEATLRSCLSNDTEDHLSKDNSKNSSVLSTEYSSSKIKAALEILLSNRKLSSPCIDLDGLEGTDAENSLRLQVRTENTETSPSQGPIKTIVFSQWTSMLDLFEYSLNQYFIQYRRLDGSMSLVARDRAVRDFNTDPEVTVMLMSLKAGNLGLNMVAACHVILLDLWWNPTTEDQAVDRAHRIGQTRPVTVSRITIKDTVEDRILALQEEKRKMVASAFGEDHVGATGARLTIDDLKYIFLGSQGL